MSSHKHLYHEELKLVSSRSLGGRRFKGTFLENGLMRGGVVSQEYDFFA